MNNSFEIVSYDKIAAANSFFRRLQDIRSFNYIIQIPRMPGLRVKEFALKVAEQAYDEALKTIQAAKFFNEDELEVKLDDDGDIQVEYQDDMFDFSIICTPKAIAIRRGGSSMKNFHEWYVRFMPHAKTVIEAILAVLSRETGRTVEPLRVEFQFKFIAHDFRDQNSNTETKNFQVIRRLVSQIPDETGKVSDTGSIDLLSRVDYKVLKWIGEPDNRRNLIYGVEAPGNKNFTSLWLTFGYVGTTYTNPQTGERESFQPSSILTEHESAYRFLRDNAINGFLSSILAGYSFKTTSGIIP